ncbi:MAG: O-succinylhomoserine sulfhydrylase [Burkholderiaceae bacterium]|nr:O-succinylhomoserine sulfhydrylase [Burkholderiaceae bacterium]
MVGKRDDRSGADPVPGFDTLAVRGGVERTHYLEHSEPIFLTSSFVFENAAQAAARFAGDEPGYVYSRASNPTVTAFQDRLAALEGAEACVATASGMAAIMATVMSLTASGSHVVAARELFGATLQMFKILERFGVAVDYVKVTDTAQWRSALRPETKLCYLESPSNPLTEIADLAAIGAITREVGVQLVVDNCLSTPALQRPLALGADIVVHSATKYLDGQGRVLGGAVLGARKFIDETLVPFVRATGPTLSAFNAWVLLKGTETLGLRMERQCANALALARWLEAHPAVERVLYPGLESHPQHRLAMAQQSAGGAVIAFEVRGGDEQTRRRRAWQVIDNCRLLSITANLGDVKTTITHPASTTHARVGPEARLAAGIGEGLLRVAVGVEEVADLSADLARGLGVG